MTITSPYPLVFEPILKELVWGGQRLAGLGKDLPAGRPFGESWEIVDLAADQSVVAQGSLAGRTLHDLVAESPAELLGPVGLDGGRFPLLVKYIDAASTLSVQVHPDEAAAVRLGTGRPKEEAWYILEAEPDAVLYLGLKPGTTRARFEESLVQGGVERLLNAVPARAGELLPVLPGTVHAIGAGVLLAEVQQPSDTTYRVHDWGRLGLDGQPRPLHVAQALDCIDFDRQVEPAGGELDGAHFRVRVVDARRGEPLTAPGPRVVVGLEGRATLKPKPQGAPLQLERGRVVLLPHSVPATVSGEARVLVISFPTGGSRSP